MRFLKKFEENFEEIWRKFLETLKKTMKKFKENFEEI